MDLYTVGGEVEFIKAVFAIGFGIYLADVLTGATKLGLLYYAQQRGLNRQEDLIKRLQAIVPSYQSDKSFDVKEMN